VTARYSSLSFVPDSQGDLLFDGIAQDAYKQNVAYALQSDAAYKLNEAHTIRGGVFLQSDRSKKLDELGGHRAGRTPGIRSAMSRSGIVDNGAKTEWLESLYCKMSGS